MPPVATFTDRLERPVGLLTDDGAWLEEFARAHPCYNHPLFARLTDRSRPIDLSAACRLLKNYDAHASHLRRLLLKAAAIMPEKAVGYILENVRNEYGNGHPDGRHQLQLQDLAWQSGITPADYRRARVTRGIQRFIKDVTPFYNPLAFRQFDRAGSRQAISAGAITATEILAIEEFKALQTAFEAFSMEHHIWFDHVTVECEHSGESIALAVYFSRLGHRDSVLKGLTGVLDANCHLYDGLLSAVEEV